MISIYIKGLDIGSFNESINSPGFYNLCEAAIDREEPIVIFGADYKGSSIAPIYLVPTKDAETGVITVKSFGATVGPDDNLTPIEEV